MSVAGLILAAALMHLPAPVRGDFDHDGKPDVAQVVPAPHGLYQLVIKRGAKGHPVSVIGTFTHHDLSHLFVTTARPGRWRTWCGKGGGNDGDPCPYRGVRLRGDTLDFGMAESTESVVLWNGKRFEVVLISD